MSNRPAGKKSTILTYGVLFLFLCFLVTAITSVVLLKRGVRLESLTHGSIAFSGLSIIWRDKLELQIQEITVRDQELSSQPDLSDLGVIRKGLESAPLLVRFFAKVRIDTLIVGENRVKAELLQIDDSRYKLNLTTDDLIFQSHLTIYKDEIRVNIIEASSQKYNTYAQGVITLEGIVGRAVGTVSMLINESFPLLIEFTADNDKISFNGKEGGEITEITSLVDLFGLSPDIQKWITDYTYGTRYHLRWFKGNFPWNDPAVLLETFMAEVRVDRPEYMFAPELEVIKGQYVDVFFNNGVLDIRPYAPTYCGQDAQNSWLDINFNDPANIILTAYIKTDAVLNDDILTLLEYYDVMLPFKQAGGKIGTDLRLTINLNTEDVSGKGTFIVERGILEWDGNKYDVIDARIGLLDADIEIQQMGLGFEDLFLADISGNIDAKHGAGDLDISLRHVSAELGKGELVLDTSGPLPQAHYHFGPDETIIAAGPSSWTFDSKQYRLGAFRAPIVFEDLAAELSRVQLDSPPGIKSEIFGYFSIKKKIADFRCDFLHYEVNDLVLKSPKLAVDVTLGEQISIRTTDAVRLSMNKIPITLYPSEYLYGENSYTIVKSRISYGTFFDSYISGRYDKLKKRGTFVLQDIDVSDKALDEYLDIGKETRVEVTETGGRFVVTLPEYNLEIMTGNDNRWSAAFGDLSLMYPRSRFLQDNNITSGFLIISSPDGKKPYTFSAEIAAPYKILVEGDTLVDQLRINGEVTEYGAFATVNDKLRIDFRDQHLSATSNYYGYNIPAILEMMDNRAKSAKNRQQDDEPIPLTFSAENSYLYLSPQSRLLADRIDLSYFNEIIDMRLLHGPGEIRLQSEVGAMQFSGENLNDAFMGALIQGAEFTNGQMSISGVGENGEFSILLKIKDTRLKSLTSLNNVMAMLNTLPALVTFSLPEYTMSGLEVESATVEMKYANQELVFETMEMHSSELQATGTGKIDFLKRSIDMDIFLTTQAGKNMSKIPIVGYVVAGEGVEPSATLKISGSIDNPIVNYKVLQEIISMPLKMLYRSLNLPFHLLEQLTASPDLPKGQESE